MLRTSSGIRTIFGIRTSMPVACHVELIQGLINHLENIYVEVQRIFLLQSCRVVTN